MNTEENEYDQFLKPISRAEFIKDSSAYQNNLDEKKYRFSSNILKTDYGNIKMIPTNDKNSDSFVNYSYAGFSDLINSHIINLKLYDGEKALILSNKDYKSATISSLPYFSKSKLYALNFKNSDGLSSQISIYDIKEKKLKHFTTLWSENFLTDDVFWDSDDNMILKLRKNDSGKISYSKLVISDIKSLDKNDIISTKKENSQSWKGEYQITTKAISNYNQKEIDLLYSISLASDESAILSIGADQAQDYWCEGEYYLTEQNGILKATGKCDEDDINDFYLKQEQGRYYIKSKRFLDQNWIVLIKSNN
ncbi:hypothetical protein PQ459_13565 [Chryseobacterium sp. KACC 21268]|nr:hypothetical protein PQ459_13565 [Chryseobacterium sp. KACC 21268]